MPETTPSEAALLDEIRQLRARIASLELERQIPKEIIEKAPVMISITRAPDFVYEFVNPAFQALAPGKEFVGRRFADVWAEIPDPLVEILQDVIATGQTFHLEDAPYTIQRGPGMPLDVVYVSYSWIPLPGPEGRPDRVLTLAHDVTGAVRQRQQLRDSLIELQQAEKALRESEERFRVAQELSPDGFLILRPLRDDTGFVTDFLWIYENDAAARMNDTNPEEVRGKRMSEVLPHHDESPFHKTYKEVAETGSVRVLEEAFYDKDTFRRRRWFRVAAVPTSGGDVAVLVQDVTERKRTGEALRESEERLRLAVDAARVGTFEWSIGEDRVKWSPTMETLYGIETEAHEHTIEEWEAFVHPDDLPATLASMQAAMRGQQPTLDITYRIVRPDGRAVWIHSRGQYEYGANGEPVRMLGVNIDISELKHAEEALRESESRERARAAEFEGILDAAPVALFVSQDPECRNMIGSRLTYEVLGLVPGANVSKSAPEGQVPTSFQAMRNGREIPPQDLPAQKAAATGQPVRAYEFDIVYEDGTCRHMLGDAVPLFGDNGKPRGAVGAFVDITELKRTEERLRQTQKLESVGLLAGGIAHDFNNLLTGVMGNASLLLEDAEPDRAEILRSIIASTERAAHLTRQLLAYSGKGQFVVRELDVTQAVNEMADLVQFSIPKSVSLALNLERRLPPIAMDPSQLQQILMNLVINAGEAIGDGNPGRIIVTTSMADVQASFTDELGTEIAPGRYVCIEVRDTGSGIDPEKKSKIFDPFFTTKFVGRGLGLAAIAGILRSEKGGIVVESALGKGSTFSVFLAAAAKGVLGVEEPGSQNGRPAILVVDDEAAVRDFITAVLRRKGYHAVQASDGQEALAVVGSAPGAIRAAIVDLIMPNMSANDLLPALKAKQPGMRILLTSGYSEAEARRLCAVYPGAAFIQKPYTAQQLAKAVEELVLAPTE